MIIKEIELSEDIINVLITLSEEWEKENSCYGYRKNTIDDIEGNRVFVAEENDEIIGYLFGHKDITKEDTTIYKNNEDFFEIEELYVRKDYRSQGIGSKLFKYVEEELKDDIQLIMLSTATKNYKAILHFYIEELGMEFWSARLFKRI